MEPKGFLSVLSKAVEAVKRLSSEGNLDRLKEAREHVEMASELIYGIVADVLGLEPEMESEERTRSARSLEMAEAIKAGRKIVDEL